MSDDKTGVHVIISGRVQGVFYRSETQKAALRHNVTGWVKNLANGDVEAVFEGHEKDVNRMIAWCHTGSPASSVDEVNVERRKELSNFTTFEVRF